MPILRNILGVVVGYLIFALSAVLLFKLSGIAPHADADFGTIAIVIMFGVVFSFAGGYVGKLIAGGGTMMVNYVLSLLIAGFAVFSLIKSSGSHYTQISAIVIFAPVSLVGGFFAFRTFVNRFS